MRIKFHGALGEVTGSCNELSDETLGVQFLVDYGMKMGGADASAWNHAEPPFDPKTLDFVLLSHAHLDHCGLIPLLYKHGFTGKVVCTRETAQLANINLMVACKHDAPYGRKHVRAIDWQEPPTPVFNRSHDLLAGITVTFRRTAHILGATSLQLEWGPKSERKRITFSGDIGNNTRGQEFQPLMRYRVGADDPQSQQSYVVMESTYGGGHNAPLEQDFDFRIASLKQQIEKTALRKNGTLVIPCFAIGRTQAVLFDLHYIFATTPELRDVPMLFDARMAREVNSIYAKGLRRRETVNGEDQPMWMSEQLHRRMGLDSDSTEDSRLLGDLLAATFEPALEMPAEANAHASEVIRDWRRKYKLISSRRSLPSDVRGPSIVITGGGMCNGGPVANYLSELLYEERNTILLTGYCSPNTNGGKLFRIMNETIKKRKKRGGALTWSDSTAAVPLASIHADIAAIGGYSGHADHEGLLDWFFGWDDGRHYPAGQTVFLTHGSDYCRQKLAEGILQKAHAIDTGQDWCASDLDIHCPDTTEDWYDMERGEWSSEAEQRPMKRVLHRASPALA